jgi:phosphoribosyl 1,2-cyclic phosphodiesterase
MKVTVLGSGSRGNSVAVTANDKTLLVDAGFGPRAVSRRAKTAGVQVDSIVGILLTHEHVDHTREAAQVARAFGCPIFGSAGTLAALESKLDGAVLQPIETHRAYQIPPFTVTACLTSHDAAESLAFTLECAETGGAKLGVAYDLGRATSAVRYLLRGCHCLIVEANHDETMLRTGPYPAALRKRISSVDGHLSNRAAGTLLASLVHKDLETVVLAHLSEQNNEPYIAERTVRETMSETGFAGNLFVARQSEPLPFIEVAGPLAHRLTEMGQAPTQSAPYRVR